MRLFQLKSGYRYTSDTIFLWNFICENWLNSRATNSLKILDVGAGCGILGLMLKRDFPNLDLSLLEIQEQNLEILRKNCEQNSLQPQILHENFANFKSEQRFDLIVSNPPFYREKILTSQNSHIALSKSATSLSLSDFVRVSNTHLKPKGALIFCYEAGKISQICEILQSYKLNLTKLAFIYPNENKPAKLALFLAQKSSRSLCEICAPIYTFLNGEKSKITAKIYEKAGLESVDIE
ncbi:tRNA1(Val) (adenine(37)-N6)-methyltransferase [Campylobacter sp. JMF_08 NE1]|uniref:tRNA1(Val) (adenine(37)-N6)-methyltransferase n=1 Tax=Campylobacter sp. JMF_08 NE1 TaxID=2983821 RepID=UPI0022E9ADA2|nr:methyltransferase [Campylobacter sp. JMF_08 NE1]MDA3048180.1 methyltransferase [Campylobacter sp. JMF_08 NE1]